MRRSLSTLLLVTSLALASLACNLSGILAELVDVGREVIDVAEVVATDARESWPTIQVEMTRMAIQFTQNAPAYYATATSVVGTAQAFVGTQGWTGAAQDMLTDAAQLISAGGGGGSLPVVGGFDGYVTSSVLVMNYGQAYSGTFETADSAHNWIIYGATGQTLTVQVSESGADVLAILYGPDGAELGRSTEANPMLRATLPSAGMFTVRIIPEIAGSYVIAYS